MAELLTHVLIASNLATLLSWRYECPTSQFVSVAMGSAMIPDLGRIDLLLPAAFLEALLGISFDWSAVHVLGGSLLIVAIGAVWCQRLSAGVSAPSCSRAGLALRARSPLAQGIGLLVRRALASNGLSPVVAGSVSKYRSVAGSL